MKLALNCIGNSEIWNQHVDLFNKRSRSIYYQLKIVIISIDYIINTHCRRKIEMVRKSFLYTFIHIFVS